MFGDKIKLLINTKKDVNNKKKIENLVVFIIILIVTLIIINSIWNGDNVEKKTENTTNGKILANVSNQSNGNEQKSEGSDELSTSLEDILESISGVGKVKVFINYSESSSIEPIYNETTKESATEETDTSGGVRTIQSKDTQKEVVYSEDDGNKQMVNQKVLMPKIEGAIITAEGVSNTNIKANIISAVQAVTGLASHKIQVFEMGE